MQPFRGRFKIDFVHELNIGSAEVLGLSANGPQLYGRALSRYTVAFKMIKSAF